MKYLVSSLFLLSGAIGIQLLHGEFPPTERAVPPVPIDRPAVSLLEGDYYLNTIDDASESRQTYPHSTPARIQKSESGEWTLEISKPTPVVIAITVRERQFPRIGGILFQTVDDHEEYFSTTIYNARLRNPEQITGRYYRISTPAHTAREGRFTLQKRQANQAGE
ncbi:MAG: hypothetical protein WD490_08245 [Opitutales bacterium]